MFNSFNKDTFICLIIILQYTLVNIHSTLCLLTWTSSQLTPTWLYNYTTVETQYLQYKDREQLTNRIHYSRPMSWSFARVGRRSSVLHFRAFCQLLWVFYYMWFWLLSHANNTASSPAKVREHHRIHGPWLLSNSAYFEPTLIILDILTSRPCPHSQPITASLAKLVMQVLTSFNQC